MVSELMHRCSLALWILLFVSTNAAAQSKSTIDIKSLAQDAFSEIIKKYEIPGMVLGITIGGEHQFFSTGVAARKPSIVVTPDTLFEVGSISKIFNVTLAALAEQQGKLNLNITVESHLPNLKDTPFGALRLMDLAIHSTGGLPLQIPSSVPDVRHLEAWLTKWKPSQPGARSYSNISIGLLGYITAKALSKSYEDALMQDLLPLMGLKNTWLSVPSAEAHRYAFGYKRTTDQPIRVNPGVLAEEAYGIKTTSRDLLRVIDLHLGHHQVSRSLHAALARTRQSQSANAYFVQAMIWEQYPWPIEVQSLVRGNATDVIFENKATTPITPPLTLDAHVMYSKTGSTNGFGAYIMFIPDEDLGVVVLANRYYPNSERVTATYNLVQKLLSARKSEHKSSTSPPAAP